MAIAAPTATIGATIAITAITAIAAIAATMIAAATPGATIAVTAGASAGKATSARRERRVAGLAPERLGHLPMVVIPSGNGPAGDHTPVDTRSLL
jgi:hypothetical protein